MSDRMLNSISVFSHDISAVITLPITSCRDEQKCPMGDADLKQSVEGITNAWPNILPGNVHC